MAAEIVREDPMIEDGNIKGLLERSRTIAVLGVSNKPERDSHRVAAYLQQVGYRMIPVNPILEEVLGQTCYPDLASIPDDIEVDIVDVFRRAEFIPEIVEDAIERGARAVWLQLGISHPEAEQRALEAGLEVISNRCIKVEHGRLLGA
jgi:predicted CoA-binding protein